MFTIHSSLRRTAAVASVGFLLSGGVALAEDAVTFRAAYLPTANYLTTVRTTGILEKELAKAGAKVEFIGPLDPFSAYNTVTSGSADASSTGTGYFVNLSAHYETNYCIAGAGEVFDVATGKTHPIAVGTVYALNQHDEHILRALKGDLHLVCVFNPPLAGTETHNAHGGYDPA